MRGEWTARKVPTAWSYSIALTCGMCGKSETVAGNTDEGALPPDIGGWRILLTPGGHADPLRDPELVVCSRGCGSRFYHDEIERLWPL